MVSVPASLNPTELNRPFYVRPKNLEHFIVAGELPVAVHFHNTSHLSIGSGFAKILSALKRQVDSKAHQAFVIRGMSELDTAH